jgi:ethanolamine ammonia-lyase small subunit
MNSKNNFWDQMRTMTSARVGLGRKGSSLPTQRVLEFQRAHAAARTAVWYPWNQEALQKNLEAMNEKVLILKSCAENRETFLRFPNLGRTLHEQSVKALVGKKTDLVFVVSDGLSALAIEKHFASLWKEFKKNLQQDFSELSYQIVFVPFGRVAVADTVGESLKAQLSVIFIGERPGLNSPDSLGIYMTFHPHKGNTDAQRNCISNVRTPLGMSYQQAADKLIYLMRESLRLKISGVELKDEQQVLELVATQTESLISKSTKD